MQSIVVFLGRLHPMVVHFPIAILILSFVFELMGRTRKFSALRVAVEPALMIGSLSAVLSAATGYLLSKEGGYNDDLLIFHQWLGLSTGIFSLITYVTIRNKPERNLLRTSLLTILVLLVSVTGHLGGSLTHGETYLTDLTINENDEAKIVSIKPIGTPESVVVYRDLITPILEARCYSCHSAQKQKGKLRLDGEQWITKGGKHGPLFSSGPVDSSLLVHRLLLPLEDEKHMPPSERSQLTSTELDLIRSWVSEGAHFQKPLSDFHDSAKIIAMVHALEQKQLSSSWHPVKELAHIDDAAVASLTEAGVIVVPIFQNSNFVKIGFVNTAALDQTILQAIDKIRENIVWLDASGIEIDESVLQSFSRLKNLRYLYLNRGAANDHAIHMLATLQQLVFLSVVGTRSSDACVDDLLTLTSLRQLYVFNTKITRQGIERLIAGNPELQVDTGGYALERLASDTLVHRKKL